MATTCCGLSVFLAIFSGAVVSLAFLDFEEAVLLKSVSSDASGLAWSPLLLLAPVLSIFSRAAMRLYAILLNGLFWLAKEVPAAFCVKLFFGSDFSNDGRVFAGPVTFL